MEYSYAINKGRKNYWYEGRAEYFPWLKDIEMSDIDLYWCLSRDLTETTADEVMGRMWNLDYLWLFLDVIKYYYEFGVYQLCHMDYLDGQSKLVIADIMRARGNSPEEIEDVTELRG